MSSFEQRGVSGEQYKGPAETHYIDTPEQVELEYSVAGIGSRFVAALLDMLIVGAFLTAELIVLVMIGAAAASSPASGKLSEAAGKWLMAFVIFINFAIFWGYFALFEAYWKGQTPGKRVMKLRVIKDSGRQITFFESLARNLVRIGDYLPSLYLIGVMTMLCNKRNQRLGDLVAGTLVVHERLDEASLLYQSSSALAAGEATNVRWGQAVTAMFPADAVAKLSMQDLMVIETFFARMLDLPMETRAAVAYRMAAQMAAKMGVALPEENPERALESMAYQMRSSGRVR